MENIRRIPNRIQSAPERRDTLAAGASKVNQMGPEKSRQLDVPESLCAQRVCIRHVDVCCVSSCSFAQHGCVGTCKSRLLSTKGKCCPSIQIGFYSVQFPCINRKLRTAKDPCSASSRNVA